MKGVISLLYCTDLSEFRNTANGMYCTDEIEVQVYKNKNSDQCIDYIFMSIFKLRININKNSTVIIGITSKNELMSLPFDCEDKNEFFQLNCFYDFHDFQFDDLIKIQEWTDHFLNYK